MHLWFANHRPGADMYHKKGGVMLSFLPGPVRGIFSFLLYTVNTLFWVGPLVLFAILKLLIPFRFWQYLSRILIDIFVTGWVDVNSFNLWLFNNIRIETQGLDELVKKSWYVVVSNHQSWVDILILQKLFIRKIPFLKFFLKQELIWVPVLGIAWWALDFPFMKRYSRSFIEKHPHLRGKDIEITRKACEKFKTIPVSIVNFMEGTRYTPEKHQRQQSPFSHLLKPKAGGIAFILNSMGDMVTGIINVTIAYPEGAKSFWQFLCGQIHHVKVHVEVIPVNENIIGNYFEDEHFRDRFQTWVNTLWRDKDKLLVSMMSSGS